MVSRNLWNLSCWHTSQCREKWSEDIERVCDDDDGVSRDVERGVAMMTIVGRPLLDPSFLRGGPMPGHRPSFHTVYNASTSTAPMQSFHRAVHSAVRLRTIISKLIILQPMQRYHPCLEILHPLAQSHSDEIYRPFQNYLCQSVYEFLQYILFPVSDLWPIVAQWIVSFNA